MDLTKLNNPIIRVDWEDVPENFTQERIRRIKQYFQEKYKTKSVVVKTITVVDKDANTKLRTLEISDSILDTNYQKKIVQEYIIENNINVDWELINRLDDKVNAEMKKEDGIPHVRYNRWLLKKIEFSNFLSYGESNIMDYTKLGGITVVESNPPNFGGKTVLSIDLIMFLLFNTTTKSKTQEDVFNMYTEATNVNVKGYLEIDGEDYTIERKLNRKRKKNGEWDVKAELIYEKWSTIDEKWENISEEQRVVTEKLIVSAIGSKEDFLTTILTTGSNVEELLEAKATARGQLLTRFLGVEIIKKKEDVCKTMYNEWAKKMVANSYNVTQLETDIEKLNEEKKTNNENIVLWTKTLDVDTKELELLNTQKETLLMKKHQDIDKELAKINPDLFQREIQTAEERVITSQKQHDDIVVKEPSEYYHEDEHSKVQSEVNTLKVSAQTVTSDKIESDISEINNLKITLQVLITEGTKLVGQVKQFKEGKTCPQCNRALDETDHTEEIKKLEQIIEDKRKEGAELQLQIKEKETELQEHIAAKKAEIQIKIKEKETELQKYVILKKEFEEYDRNKLRKEKASLEIQQKQMDLDAKKVKFHEWEKNRSKLEENVQVEQQLVTVRTGIDKKTGEIDAWKDSIKTATGKITTANKTIEEKNVWIVKIRQEEKVELIFKTYLSIFGKNGISKSIMKNMIPLINQELVRILADTCHFALVININDKNEVEFTMIDNESRVEKGMSTGSGYEKTVASLALRAVLSKVSALPKPNIVVMDEIFGKIADENIDMVGEFFIKIKNYFEHILLITHNPLIKNWSDHVITIKKENNVSVIDGLS